MDYYELMRNYYENEGQEEARLQKGSVQHLEFLTATKYLDACLPPESHVLDSCAGTGAYAFYLAGKGHRVSAGDLVAFNVEAMQKKQAATPVLSNIYQGDALDLSRFASASFDAVLCMGALYHLPNADDRRRAVQQSLRVLRPGGLFVASTMNRYAVVLNNLQRDLGNLEDMLRFAKTGLEGIFYAGTAGEMEALAAACGLEKRTHVALDGMAYFLMHTARLLDEGAFDKWCRYHFAVCEDASLLGSSYHNLYIGTKKA